jgi:hypothetical protein
MSSVKNYLCNLDIIVNIKKMSSFHNDNDVTSDLSSMFWLFGEMPALTANDVNNNNNDDAIVPEGTDRPLTADDDTELLLMVCKTIFNN